MYVMFRQDESSQGLKAFGAKLWTLRTVDSGEGTTDALFGKVNAVVMDMIQQVHYISISISITLHYIISLGGRLRDVRV